MHFTIPETVERKFDGNDAAPYVTFEVHLNGIHHCSVRYRQLHHLHAQLKKEVPSCTAPFPPKKFHGLIRGSVLSGAQLNERRLGLERWLQTVAQPGTPTATSLALQGFMLAAQQETWDPPLDGGTIGHDDEVDLKVFLMNDQQYNIRGRPTLQTEDILEALGQQIGIPEDLVFCFGLFLVHRPPGNSIQILRKFQNHESPYISLKAQPGTNIKLVLRKWSWNPHIEEQLCAHKGSLNVVYTQALADVESGLLQASNDTRRHLASLQARGAKAEYMETARALKDYGHLHFMPCLCDYPATNSRVSVLIGNRELIIRMLSPDRGGDMGGASAFAPSGMKEGKFRITRMRCWRIMSAQPAALSALTTATESSSCHGDPAPPTPCASCAPALELSFEYLMPSGNKDMQWISITSPQAILMSHCLQSMVEELVRTNRTSGGGGGQRLKRPGDGSTQLLTYTHRRQDGSEIEVPVRVPVPSRNTINNTFTDNRENNRRNMARRQYSVQSLTERFDVVQMKDASIRAAENVLIENEAFQDIKEPHCASSSATSDSACSSDSN